MNQYTVSENEEENLTHYEKGAFTKTYKSDGAVYYASFHPELYPEEDGLDATGRYLIVLLQPGGLSQFYMSFDGDKWGLSEEHFSAIDVDDTVNTILDDTQNEKDIPTIQCNLFITSQMVDWLSEAIINHQA